MYNYRTINSYKQKHNVLEGELVCHPCTYDDKYVLPVQMMKGEPVSLSSDVFNYGMLLYEIFVGKLPFHEAKTDTAVISKITSGEVRIESHRV